MKWQYSKWDDSFKLLKDFSSLYSYFNYLLLQANGDVHEVIQWMKYLQKKGFLNPDINMDEFIANLEEENLLRQTPAGYELTRKGEGRIRQDALLTIFGNMRKSSFGEHRVTFPGNGGENLSETRPYTFGDSVTNIDSLTTLNNAILNSGPDNIHIREEDIAVYEKEHTSSCATVLLIDISHSMVIYGEDRITPAKQVALALTELILTRFSKDKLHLVTFGDEAREITVKDLPYLRVGRYHTNTKAGLQLAQILLRRQKYMNKQIFMITDGKPSAIIEEGKLYKNPYGLDEKIVKRTLDEANLCRRNKIVVTTFMVAQDPLLVDFVDQFTKINQGRAYYTSPQTLGEYIFVDYLKNRRKKLG
jgi:uncharacterized protein with von Willebrand factor type A (vWA) domain